MALGTSPFSAEWSTHHRPVVNAAMTTRVKIERKTSEGKYNPATGEYEGGTMVLLYEGRANVDRIARPTRREFVSDAADNQVVQVLIPLVTDLRFQSNDQLTVLDDEGVAMMVGEEIYLRGWFPDSVDWAHTLHFGFNSKQG